MASEKPIMYTSYVVDGNKKWKIRCKADNFVIMRLQAAKIFCEDWSKVDFDRVVVYETGEFLEDDRVFAENRNYLYLKPEEEYTFDPAFNLDKMALKKPPRIVRPKKREPPKPSEKILDIYRFLGANKRYEDDKYWTYDEATLKEISACRTKDLCAKLDHEIEDPGAISTIMMTAGGKWLSIDLDEDDYSY